METELLKAGLISDQQLGAVLKRALASLGISIPQFSSRSGIPLPTLYKLIQGKRSPRLSTLRKLLNAIGELEHSKGFVGVIASKHVLSKIPDQLELEGKIYQLRKYPVESAEQALIAGVNAEKQGARAIVCAPIIANALNQMLSIPAVGILPGSSVLRAISEALRRSLDER